MKYCYKCGNELVDDAYVCPKCGCLCENSKPTPRPTDVEDKPIKGTALGIVLGLFTWLIGFVLCFFLGDQKAKRACTITVIVATILYFLVGIFLLLYFASTFERVISRFFS